MFGKVRKKEEKRRKANEWEHLWQSRGYEEISKEGSEFHASFEVWVHF